MRTAYPRSRFVGMLARLGWYAAAPERSRCGSARAGRSERPLPQAAEAAVCQPNVRLSVRMWRTSRRMQESLDDCNPLCLRC
jgi:hypothetical protein